MHISRTTALATAGLIALGSVGGTLVATPERASAATGTHDAALTARVTKIQHATGRVTLTGTATPDTNVFVGGDVTKGAAVRADAAGAWTATATTTTGEHVLQVSSDSDWAPIRIPVTLQEIRRPILAVGTGAVYREAHVTGNAVPGSNVVVFVDDVKRSVVRADELGRFEYLVRDLSFGEHRFTVTQRFDGADNGTTSLVKRLVGTPTVTTSTVDFDEHRIRLAGTAPTGTTVRFRHEDGTEVVGTDGTPITAEVNDSERWWAYLPLPDGDVRRAPIEVVVRDGDDEVGTERTSVLIPRPLTARVDGTDGTQVRFAGEGEPGATVAFTHENGAPLRDGDGAPITAIVGKGTWQKTLDSRGLSGARILLVQTVDGTVTGRTSITVP